MSRRRKVAFLDRDGVINVDRGYVHRAADLELLPGVIDGLKRLARMDFLLAVVTNQSGIARGYYAESDHLLLMQHLDRVLANEGVSIAGARYCPHLPDATIERYRAVCRCRKPEPGQILSLAEEFDVDLMESILVGDKISDIQAGRAAGVGHCFLVASGQPVLAADAAIADGLYKDLAACAAALESRPIRVAPA